MAQLCFKLTESELKILLANMAEWRDFERIASSADSEIIHEADGTWQKYSRGVTYYRLISQLATKLRSIFLPSLVSQTILSLFIPPNYVGLKVTFPLTSASSENIIKF